MKIATWNVNSVRSRQQHICNWLTDNPVEALCLQETKVVDPGFPREPFEQLGYQLAISGQKSYNGVAILTREPLAAVSRGFASVVGQSLAQEFDEQKRVITGILNGVRIVNLYVPNGSSVGSEKYDYKLRWLKVLRDYLAMLLEQGPEWLCVCGDFNVALEDRDIYDPTGKATHIMSSTLEREALLEVLDVGLQDAFRKFHHDGGHFSWWDYRGGSFQRNRGWRIDHHYLSPALYERALSCIIDVEPRKVTKPSDHAPVIVELSPEFNDDR